MSALGPLDHIARTPLPWRAEPDLTECGKPIADLAGRVVARAEVEARIKAVGKQRAAFSTCMTCAATSDRWTRENQRTGSAITSLAREVTTVQHAHPPRSVHYGRHVTYEEPSELWERHQRLVTELVAITALVQAHRNEFDAYLAGLRDTVKLADRRGHRRRLGGVT